MTINGVNYAEGEPYTYLSNVICNVRSQSRTATVLTHEIKLSSNREYLQLLEVGAVQWTSKIRNLFFNSRQKALIVQDITTISYNQTQLKFTPIQGYLYKNGEKLDSDAFSITDKTLNIVDFDDAAEYVFIYSYSDTDFLAFTNGNYPYFSATLTGVGNDNGNKINFVMRFDKLSLAPDTPLIFSDTAQNSVKLNFYIIDPQDTVSIKFN